MRTPLNLNMADTTAVINSIGNLYTNSPGAVSDVGTAFVPAYAYTPDAASAVEAAVRAGAGPK